MPLIASSSIGALYCLYYITGIRSRTGEGPTLDVLTPPSLPGTPFRPICRPLAHSLYNIDERLCDDTIGLLARMELIVPQIAVWTGSRDAVSSCCIASIDRARDIERRCTVQVLGWIVVDVAYLCLVSVYFGTDLFGQRGTEIHSPSHGR